MAMLREHERHRVAADLAARAWARTTMPAFSPEFSRSSNWVRIGTLYAHALREAGDTERAREVSRRLREHLGGG